MSLGLPDRHWNVLQWGHLAFSARTRASEKPARLTPLDQLSFDWTYSYQMLHPIRYELISIASTMRDMERSLHMPFQCRIGLQCCRYTTGYPATGTLDQMSMSRSIPPCPGVSLHVQEYPSIQEYLLMSRSIPPCSGASLQVQEYPPMSRSIPPCPEASTTG